MSVSIVMEKANSGLIDNLRSPIQRNPLSNNEAHNELQNQSAPKAASNKKNAQLNLGILEDLIGYQLRRAQMSLFQSFNKHLDHAKITPGQIGLLIKIRNNAGISQTALARANGIERSTLGEIIDRFEKRELVDRRKHATDRRAYALHLSAQGETFLDEVVPTLLKQEADFLKGWEDEEKQTLVRLLSKLADTSV